MPNFLIELGMLVQIISAVASIIVALVMYLSVREIKIDRRREYLEKRIEEFYIPLIKFFGQGDLPRDIEAHQKVEEIILTKRYLCGRKLAKILPQHFTAMIISGSHYYFYFTSEEEKKKWEEIADIVWDEYIETLKKYYKLIGVIDYVLPKKPDKWFFDVYKH
ncbi:MAG: hypothetical protein GU359_04800 [Desulfurococcales archaeon]|jgi:hypothetical protein|nr:hypothetical protein [Desulfurococcales archaeon]